MNDKDRYNRSLEDDDLNMVSGGISLTSNATDDGQGEIIIIPKDEAEEYKIIPAKKEDKNKNNSSISNNKIVR